MKTEKQKTDPHKHFLCQWLALALALLVVGGIIVTTLYREHRHIEKRERERLAAQAKVIDENLGRQLDGVYHALVGIRKELPPWDGKGGMLSANRYLRVMADGMPGVRTILITDAAGKIIASNRENVIGQNISYREYFQALLNNPDPATLHISPPYTSLLGKFVITTGIMIPGAKGVFAGVVAASLDPEYFAILLGSVLYAPDMWTALAHGDGKLFLRVPGNNDLAGLDLARPGTLFTRHMNSALQATLFTGSVPPGGEQRLMAQRTIRPGKVPVDKPLVVAVSRDLAALYAGWRREAFGKVALFMVLVLAMVSALYFYQRRQRKFETISAGVVEELLQAKEAAVCANVDKSRFLATVAHEFRTPLSILASSTDILDRYGERLNREERTVQHDRIRNAARRMSDLVDSVLSFNRVAAATPQNGPVAVDIGKLCRDIAEEVKTIRCNGHEFSVTISADCGTALLDETLFRRVVENLLTNAFRYTPAEGAVSLNVNRESGRLLVVVTDSGIGIPKEDQNRVFEAFYRSRNVELRLGLGLGLAIVHDALLHMGGTITIDSSIGRGTTMRAEIPLVDTPDSTPVKQDKETPSSTQS